MTKFSNLLIINLLIFSFLGVNITAAQNTNDSLNTDSDGLTDYQETMIYHTDPNNPDSDNDGFNDGAEIANGYSPLHKNLKLVKADSDNDGLNDDWEIKLGSNLMAKDSDNDGYYDGTEVYKNYLPTDPKPQKIKKRIEVSTEDLNLKFYINDILMDTIPVSTGKPKTPTPLGKFSIIAKYPLKNYNIYPNTKWNLHFATKNGLKYYIHGAYWHNKFGKEKVSGGCVNVRYEDMERLYIFASIGTEVIVK